MLFTLLLWVSMGFAHSNEADFYTFFKPAWKSNAHRFTERGVLLDYLLSDPERRLETDFQISRPQKERVKFWTQIYSKFSSRQKVVHDRNHPSLLYGCIDFSPLYHTGRSRYWIDWQRRRLERQVLARLRQKLRIALGQAKGPMDLVERLEILSFLSRHIENSSELARLPGSLRTQQGQSDMFLLALIRSDELLPKMEAIFRERQMPASLTRIPFVESSFNPKARSRAGAIGMWQFMPPTARAVIDRKNRALWHDPIAQTRGASNLLLAYRRQLPDWGSAIISYNSGIGRISRLVRRHRFQTVEALLMSPHTERKLGFAGKNFLAEVLAANLIEAYRGSFFTEKTLHEAYHFLHEFNGLPSPFRLLPVALSKTFNANYSSIKWGNNPF